MERQKEGLSAQNGRHKEGVVLPGRVDGAGSEQSQAMEESLQRLTPRFVPAGTPRASAPYLPLSWGSKMVAYC